MADAEDNRDWQSDNSIEARRKARKSRQYHQGRSVHHQQSHHHSYPRTARSWRSISSSSKSSSSSGSSSLSDSSSPLDGMFSRFYRRKSRQKRSKGRRKSLVGRATSAHFKPGSGRNSILQFSLNQPRRHSIPAVYPMDDGYDLYIILGLSWLIGFTTFVSGVIRWVQDDNT